MEFELNIDNILGAEEIDNLFLEDTLEEDNTSQEKNKKTDEETTEIVDVNKLFTEESESVGSEDKGKENTSPNKEGTSPEKNFYSSIAVALKEEGIFPDLDEDSIKKISSPEAFVEAIENQIKSKFDERQKRIDEALSVGMEPTEIKRYESTLNYLDSLKEDDLKDESEKGENLRQQLIYQDFINRGYSVERAKREIKKSFDSGTDIEDAKEALESNKEFFKNQYDSLIKEAKEEEEKEIKERNKQSEELKKSILEDNKVFGEISLDKSTRQKAYDSITKPVYKDPNTGELLTAVQKYEKDNRVEFLKNIGLIFTLTDGFKNLEGLVKKTVNKEVSKSLRELEHTINNTSRTSGGNLKFANSVDDDPESFIGKDWNIDV